MLALDTETHPISKTKPLPEPVCISYTDGELTDLVSAREASQILDIMGEVDINIFHNAGFDMGNLATNGTQKDMRKIFRLYETGQIRDTVIREALDRISKGQILDWRSMTLESLTRKYTGVQLDKGEDSYRLRYAELQHIPISEWPRRARSYAKADAASTFKVYENQKDRPDEVLQCRADFCLKLMSAHGIYTDEEKVDAFELGLYEQIAKYLPQLKRHGLVRKDGPKKNTRDTKRTREMVLDILGERTPRTNPSKRFPNGQIKYDEDTLRETGDERLEDLAEYAYLKKLIDTYVPIMRRGIDDIICAGYRVLVDTGRTSCSDPNMQNVPIYPGARDCYRARKGCCLVSVDYALAELRALAQNCFAWFGQSEMRDAIIAGQDLHLLLASDMLGISYEDALARYKKAKHRQSRGKPLTVEDREIIETRQVSKNMNFGMAGGLGPDAFVSYVRAQTQRKIILTPMRAKELKALWMRRWTEMRPYFRAAAEDTDEFADKTFTQRGSGRVRGGLRFTQRANQPFQGDIADLAKDAIWQVTKACYVDERSDLYGARPIIFVHDELVLECEIERCHEVGEELRRIMVEVEETWLPDVPGAGDLHAMIHWAKGAEETRDRHGRLVPYEFAEKRKAA